MNTIDKTISNSIKLEFKDRYTRLFSTKNNSAISLRSGCVTLQPGESIGEHNTGDSEEILIILEGEGELSINSKEKLPFKENTALYVPPNTTHDVRNTGKGSLRYIFVTCPAK